MILMGIVNLTPDSFFAPSRAEGVAAVAERIRELARRGCCIFDLGAVSTRPGAAEVSPREEWRRLEPVLEWMAGYLCREWPGAGGMFPPLSIDTTRSEIVRKAYGVVGRFIVNDISAGEDGPGMLSAVAELDLPYVAMHKRGNPRTMDALCDYPEGVVKEIDDYFRHFAQKASEAGVRDWILDPGFGFAKTPEQNWELLENLAAFRHFGRPILAGVADKRFTRTPNPFAGSGEENSGSAYAERLAARRGADILRIH